MWRIFIVLAVTAVVMTGIFRGAGWYADNAALPRYCAAPEPTLAHVAGILTGQTDDFNDDRRGFVVASKLIFLVPQSDGEVLDDYLERLRRVIARHC